MTTLRVLCLVMGAASTRLVEIVPRLIIFTKVNLFSTMFAWIFKYAQQIHLFSAPADPCGFFASLKSNGDNCKGHRGADLRVPFNYSTLWKQGNGLSISQINHNDNVANSSRCVSLEVLGTRHGLKYKTNTNTNTNTKQIQIQNITQNIRKIAQCNASI